MTTDATGAPSPPDLAAYTAALILARPPGERMPLYVTATRTYRALLAGHPTSASFADRSAARKFNDGVLRMLEASTPGDVDGWRR